MTKPPCTPEMFNEIIKHQNVIRKVARFSSLEEGEKEKKQLLVYARQDAKKLGWKAYEINYIYDGSAGPTCWVLNPSPTCHSLEDALDEISSNGKQFARLTVILRKVS